MLQEMRKPFFIAALVLLVLVVLVEIGAAAGLLGGAVEGASAEDVLGQVDVGDLGEEERAEIQGEVGRLMAQGQPPGQAIPYMALVDGMLLFVVALMGLGMLVRERVYSRIHGIALLIFSIILLLVSIGLIFVALGLVVLKVSLFVAAPFGTIAYLARYGFFDRGGASLVLGLVMMLKIGVVVCLVLAHQRFIQNKSLVLLVLTSFLCGVIISFLHGLVPRFLVSITDGIAAIIIAILAVIWAIVMLIRSIPAVLRALNISRV